MSECFEPVSYFIPKGLDYKEVFVLCGNTDPHGSRAICDICRANPEEMKRIENHEANMAADNAWLRSAGQGEM